MVPPPHPLTPIKLVLVRPAGPRNVGSVARLMKNMGLQRLVLVDPQCDPQDPEAVVAAVHGVELLQGAEIVNSLLEAVADCQRIVGTSGRHQNYPPEWRLESPRHALPWLIGGMMSAVVFGPEVHGLSNAELSLCQRHVMIPASVEYPSLNLAQAVAICGYELRLAYLQMYPHAEDEAVEHFTSSPQTPTHLPSTQLREAFFEQMQRVLLEISYLQPHTVARKMTKLRALFNRAELTVQEIALLRGILRRLQWAHGRKRP